MGRHRSQLVTDIFAFLNTHGDIPYSQASGLADYPAGVARVKYDVTKSQWNRKGATKPVATKTRKIAAKRGRKPKAVVAPVAAKRGRKPKPVVVATPFEAAMTFVRQHGNIAKAKAFIANQAASIQNMTKMVSDVEAMNSQLRQVS